MTTILVAIAIVLVGVLLSALYSGLETGLYTINHIRLDVRAAANIPSALRLKAFIDKPTRMLAVLLVCNNIANYLASYGTAMLLDQTSFNPWVSIGVTAMCLIPILFIFGEILPKDLFRSRSDSLTYTYSSALKWADTLFLWTGIVPVISFIGNSSQKFLGTESDIEPSPRRRFGLLFKEGLGTGAISNEQTTLADRVLTMRSLTVANEMVPWARVSCVNIDVTSSQRNAALKNSQYTRFPVIDKSGYVQGVLPAIAALLELEKPTSEIMRPVQSIESTMSVGKAIKQVRESGQPMAIVTSPNSKIPIGLVTLKDLVEPLVGELAAW
jgi:putative hemolysin